MIVGRAAPAAIVRPRDGRRANADPRFETRRAIHPCEAIVPVERRAAGRRRGNPGVRAPLATAGQRAARQSQSPCGTRTDRTAGHSCKTIDMYIILGYLPI